MLSLEFCRACGPGVFAAGCASCENDARARLSALPALYAECLESMAGTARRLAVMERVSGSHRIGTALNPELVVARSAIHDVLASWVALVVDERPVAAPARTEVAEAAQFLTVHWPWLRRHPGIADFMEEMDGLVRAALSALDRDRATPRRLCAEPGCTAPVTISIAAQAGTTPAIACCARGHRLPLARLAEAHNDESGRKAGRRVPTRVAALAAGVTEATIRQWASRGKLIRYGSPGRAEYDIDELLDMVGGQPERASDPGGRR
ncbi:hypothetical protein [Nocardia sp. NPDC052316]|uniref:hypothetical protein n=1 Tax=Nocardia sp. NPDC052316 TaxID=3364329 RepID=UPI0037CB40B7